MCEWHECACPATTRITTKYGAISHCRVHAAMAWYYLGEMGVLAGFAEIEST